MARPLRIQYPDAWYHVMNRGRRGEKIFNDNDDYHAFIALVQESCTMWHVRVAAYCLMSNHYHMLVQTPAGNLDRCMRHINGVYTQRFNRKFDTDGTIFRGRYKAILVDADNYLLELVRYIHKNPVSAGIVTDHSDYPWSSNNDYLSKEKSWLYRSFVFSLLTRKKADQRLAYRAFINQEPPKEITKFFSKKNLSSILGDASFVETIRKRFFRWKKAVEIPETVLLTPTIAQIMDAVCSFYKVTADMLVASRRGIENEPRNVALYLARIHTGKTLTDIGQAFNIDNYSTVSSVICKVSRKAAADKGLRKAIEAIRGQLENSQKQT